MRTAELALLPRGLAFLIAAVGLLAVAAPRPAQALTLDIKETQSKVFVAGQINTWAPPDTWTINAVGPNWTFPDIFFPDVSANSGFGDFFRFVVLNPVSATAPGPSGHLTTNTFGVRLEYWDPLTSPITPQSTMSFNIFLTTLPIAQVNCGQGSDLGSFGSAMDLSGNLRLEGIACVPQLPGVFTDQFVNFEVAAQVNVASVPEPAGLLLMGLTLAALAFAPRRNRA